MSATEPLPVGDPVPDVETPHEVSTARLEGRYVTLRRPRPDADAAPLYAAGHADARAKALWTYMSYGPFPSEGAFRDWLDSVGAGADPWFFTVTDGQGVPIGMASLMNIDLGMRRMEIGNVWYVPSAQATEANTEVATLLLREAFTRYRCRRVEWKCDSLNARSRHAALRLGFIFEGVFRNHMIIKGRNRDTAYYAMTDDEWRIVEPVLDRWLGEDASRRRPLGDAVIAAQSAAANRS